MTSSLSAVAAVQVYLHSHLSTAISAVVGQVMHRLSLSLSLFLSLSLCAGGADARCRCLRRQ
jgi:hypothetical protein